MICIKIAWVIVIILLMSLGYGVVYHYIAKPEKLGWDDILVKGFVCVLAVFEVCFFLCNLLSTSALLMFVTFGIISGILIILAFALKRKIVVENGLIGINCFSKIIGIFFLIGVIGLGVYISWTHFDVFDDGYYISIANIALEENKIELSDYYVYTGCDFFQDFSGRPGISSWELLVAFWCWLSGIHPAIMFHTVLPVILIPLFVMAAEIVLKNNCPNYMSLFVALFLYCILACLWDGKMSLISPYFTVGTYNGKALLWYLIFPIITEYGIKLYKGLKLRREWLIFTIIAFAGICVQSTGIYAVPMFYLSMAIPYITYVLVKKTALAISMIRNMLLCILPVVPIWIYAVKSLSSNVLDYKWNVNSFDFLTLQKDVVYNGLIYVIVYIITIIAMLISTERRYLGVFFGLKTISLMVFVFNPLMADKVARYIAGAEVFFRLYYIFTFGIVISFLPIIIFEIVKLRILKVVVLTILTIIFIISDDYNTFSYYSRQISHQNLYMIRNDVMEIIDYFNEQEPQSDIYLLSDYSVNRYFRQYSSRFKIVVARGGNELPPGDLTNLYRRTYDYIFNKGIIDEETIEGIERFNVKYLLCTNMITEQDEFRLVYKTEEGSLFLYERQLSR